MLLWVHKNEKELTMICPGWHSEQIIRKDEEGGGADASTTGETVTTSTTSEKTIKLESVPENL